MNLKPATISAFLKQLARAAERLTDDQIEDVVAGRSRLVLSTEEQARDREKLFPPLDFEELIARLKSAETREAANDIIERSELTKAQLAQVAKQLDLPTQRSDGVDRLREKITEATVGYRLTSAAIHRNPQQQRPSGTD